MRTAASGDLPRREEGRPARARAGAAAPGCAASRGRAGKRAGERMPNLNFKRIMGGGQRTRLRQSAMRATGGRQDAERASCHRGAGQARGRGAHKITLPPPACARLSAPPCATRLQPRGVERGRSGTPALERAQALVSAERRTQTSSHTIGPKLRRGWHRAGERRAESGSRAARQGLRARAALKVTRHFCPQPGGCGWGGKLAARHKLTKRGRSLAKPNQQRRTPTKAFCPQHFSATLLRGNGHFFTNCGQKLLQRCRTFLP